VNKRYEGKVLTSEGRLVNPQENVFGYNESVWISGNTIEEVENELAGKMDCGEISDADYLIVPVYTR